MKVILRETSNYAAAQKTYGLTRKRRYKGYHFWARGYFVSTTGYQEEVVRRYIRNQEKQDKAADYADLFKPNY